MSDALESQKADLGHRAVEGAQKTALLLANSFFEGTIRTRSSFFDFDLKYCKDCTRNAHAKTQSVR